MEMTRIMVVDDHTLVRHSLSERLRREPTFDVVATLGSAIEAAEKLSELRPDVILMDINIRGHLSFDVVRRITETHPRIKTIFLSGYVHDQYIDQALQVGARGYLTKYEPPETVIAAIREAMSGGAFFSEEVRERIVVDSHGAKLSNAPRSRTSTLSRREMEVLRFVGRGWSKKLIALKIHLSIKTVDHHISRIMSKLDLHSTVDLVRFAIREGLADA